MRRLVFAVITLASLPAMGQPLDLSVHLPQLPDVAALEAAQNAPRPRVTEADRGWLFADCRRNMGGRMNQIINNRDIPNQAVRGALYAAGLPGDSDELDAYCNGKIDAYFAGQHRPDPIQ